MKTLQCLEEFSLNILKISVVLILRLTVQRLGSSVSNIFCHMIKKVIFGSIVRHHFWWTINNLLHICGIFRKFWIMDFLNQINQKPILFFKNFTIWLVNFPVMIPIWKIFPWIIPLAMSSTRTNTSQTFSSTRKNGIVLDPWWKLSGDIVGIFQGVYSGNHVTHQSIMVFRNKKNKNHEWFSSSLV